jgi:hypothetical protein
MGLVVRNRHHGDLLMHRHAVIRQMPLAEISSSSGKGSEICEVDFILLASLAAAFSVLERCRDGRLPAPYLPLFYCDLPTV